MSEPASESPFENPYRPPSASLAPPSEDRSEEGPMAETVDRNEHLPMEATVRTIGLMFMLTPLLSLINTVATAFSSRFDEIIAKQAALAHIDPSRFRIMMYGMTIFGGSVGLILGIALRSLKNWARWIIIVLGTLGICGTLRSVISPVPGTMTPLAMVSLLITAAISVTQVVLLVQSDASHVCSQHYRFVISTTPEIRPQLGLRDQILLGAFGTNAILGIASGFV